MIAKGFMSIFWGLLFTLLDIHLCNFDILPDFIGYIFIAVGLGRLAVYNPRFRTARILAWILVFGSIPSLYQVNVGIQQVHNLNLSMWILPLLAVGLLLAVLDLVMVWRICGGIIEMATAVGNFTLARVAKERRIFYILCPILTIFMLGVILIVQSGPLLIVSIIVLLVIYIILLCLMMGLLRLAARDLAEAAIFNAKLFLEKP